MVCENKVLKKLFGPKREEITEEWRRLHNEELHDLYCSLNHIRVIKPWWLRVGGGGYITYV